MSDIEEKLIKSVKQQACLYNKSNAGFRNRQKRDRAWAQVSMECGLPGKYTHTHTCMHFYMCVYVSPANKLQAFYFVYS